MVHDFLQTVWCFDSRSDMIESDLLFMEEDVELELAMDDIMNELIDEVSLGLCFEIHRASKIGTLFISDTDPKSSKELEVVEKPGLDVFGQAPTKKQFECICPNCQRHLAASRFAPHLEKCMGMGRNSSRIASRRIATNSTLKRDSDDSGPDHDDNDNDWTYQTDSKRIKKLKKERSTNSPRRNKFGKFSKNGGDIYNDRDTGTPEPRFDYDDMTLEERKSLLLNTCGVISEHTKKMCTRSMRCPQHNDEQRLLVRKTLLRSLNSLDEDIHVDIDSFDDGDNQALRETLQWEASSNSSPADSTSTNNSTSSRKRSSKNNSRSNGAGNNNSSNRKKKKTNSSSSNLYDFS
ncbi:ataxin-7-like protein 3 isoform X2 [Patella vulgata]|uniref:ataxin-7-like protein 3 isoform X2 n=1 Tax=Patella vulgata TaxID=6465 RepID=UPI0021808CF7|nr:ataxin-7-like protein 3 isoform X2 [Patella vulgata]